VTLELKAMEHTSSGGGSRGSGHARTPPPLLCTTVTGRVDSLEDTVPEFVGAVEADVEGDGAADAVGDGAADAVGRAAASVQLSTRAPTTWHAPVASKKAHTSLGTSTLTDATVPNNTRSVRPRIVRTVCVCGVCEHGVGDLGSG